MLLNLHDVPGTHSFECRIPLVALGTDDAVVVGVAPFNCTVTGVEVMHDAAITGNNTNNFASSILNGGADGTGTDIVATKNYVTGTNGAIWDDTLTLSSNASLLNLDAGDVIRYGKVEAGSGLADPAKLVRISFKAR